MRPNVVFIDCHDLGDWLGCYGRPYVSSPNIDRLASQGTRFTSHFAGAPICGPSRICLYTSRSPHSVGVYGNASYTPGGDCIPMARWFAEHGYATVNCGGWKTNGTIEWAGYQERTEFGPDSERTPEFVSSLASHARESGRPFFAHFSFQLVHRMFGTGYDPLVADAVAIPKDMPDIPTTRRDLASFCRNIELLDGHVGRILDALHANDLGGSTIVVFVTDHGAPIARAKHTLYDAGLRTSLIIRAPESDVSVCDELLSNFDLLPTLCELAGLAPPSTAEGRSFASLFAPPADRDATPTRNAYVPREEVFFEFTYGQRSGMQYYTPCRGVRTRRYKLIRNYTDLPFYIDTDFLGRFPRSERPILDAWPYYGRTSPPRELYDLDHDPWEEHNLLDDSGWQDTPDNAALLTDLERRLDGYMRAGNDELLAGRVESKKDSPIVQQWVMPENGTRYKLHYDPVSETREQEL